jgi:UPF0755 protein
VSGTVFSPNFATETTCLLYIHQEKDFELLCRQLNDSAQCRDIASFIRVAACMRYPENMKTGCYAIRPGMNNYELLNDLRRGNQTPVQVTFNNVRTGEELAVRLSTQLMMKGEEFTVLLDDTAYCRTLGFTPQTLPALFIPNTYEIYWNVSADRLMQRMLREYDIFWTPERRGKAEKIGISPVEVATLASIVEEETAVMEEYPVIAGLYINRLHRGMLLQADPTVKFALGDFSLQRILYAHLNVDSPYNTYLHGGLPPGPIRIPSITGLEAVLNYTKHNYIYMCAKDDFSGRHNFSVSLAEHNRNAVRYRTALNRTGVR